MTDHDHPDGDYSMDIGRMCLLVVDMQKGWFEISEGMKDGAEGIMDVINDTIGRFRDAGRPIIFSQHCLEKWGFHKGSPRYEFVDRIDARETDIVIEKKFMNSFRNTELPDIMKKLGCDQVLIAGTSACHCVMATFFGAYELDLSPRILRGGVLAPEPKMISACETACMAISMDDLFTGR